MIEHEKEIMNNWHEWFSYDESSPSCLRYKKQRRGTKVRPGDCAGTLKSDNYYCLGFNTVTTRVHRIIWEMFNGKIPEKMVINHINTVRNDNRIENLEVVTQHENMLKTSQHLGLGLKRNNKSGYVGVRFQSSRDIFSIVAQYADKPKSFIEKTFSFKNLNEENFISKMKLAITWRNSKIRECISMGMAYPESAANQIFNLELCLNTYEKVKTKYIQEYGTL